MNKEATMTTNVTMPTPLPRVARFEGFAYGLFLHWGLYSQMGRGEWIQFLEKIPQSEYAKLKDTFTAADWDAPAVARLAKEAGMRYITLTTRHHDGFSLYDTRGLNTYDASHSPAGRDLIAEFADACRAEGIVPFFYHTTLDWTWDSANCSEEKFAEYLDYLKASVEVLCTHYGDVGGFFFDGNWSRPQSNWKEDDLYGMIHRLQPDAIIINNTGLAERGKAGHPEIDSVTFEQGLPTLPDRAGAPKYLAAEMCETMNRHWGLGANDFRYLSPVQVIEHLCACRKVGANYLLNLGPMAQGAMPEYEAALLRRVGDWVQLMGDVVYEGRPVPGVQCSGKDFVLEKAGKIYYFAHDLTEVGDPHVTAGESGNGPRAVSGLPRPVAAARWLDNGERSIVAQNEEIAAVECSGFGYGTNLVVRVAELLSA